ncbi:hypothetical protein F7734_48965 [Scytonema sp. UIC 10036]|uniref:hypothetical protein n=1 Tax=Scytonema sp. UIC 10036 TaxID=2304196 RepID=UPI0012DA095A|nr:hypothetical protein [Scytonema sp. UIC 10036]MUG99790.1 hypothetical protein [Scytonema sp. UIC 10036]
MRKSAKTINLGVAGFIKTDSEGYATGELIQVQAIESELNGETVEQIEWIWAVESTKGTSKMYLWTRPNINPNKYISRPEQGEAEYSLLTQLLLNLGLLSENNLDQLRENPEYIEELDIDLEELQGQQFRFKLIPGKMGKPSKPDVKTIELLTVKPDLEV